MLARLLLLLLLLLLRIPALIAQSTHTIRCCKKLGVSDACAESLCDAQSPPSDLDVYTVFTRRGSNCSRYLDEISECLNQGRDNSVCCKREALDADQNACFGICNARTVLAQPWGSVQSCLAINVREMYSCIARGYRVTPTPPENFRLAEKTKMSATLKWDVPKLHANLVTIYKVVVTEHSLANQNVDTTWETSDLQLYVPDLKEDRVYSARITAVHNASHSSLAAPLLLFSTSSVSTNLQAYRSPVPTAIDAKTSTMACRLRYIEDGPKEVIWERASKGGRTWRPVVESVRHHITNYVSDEGAEGLFRVSTLQITDIDSSDLGDYRCRYLGESAVVKFLAVTKAAPNFDSPPESALDCCQRHEVRSECEYACSRGLVERSRPARPGYFPPHFKCINEFTSLLKCSLGGMSHGECCLRKKVPFYCIGLCDSRHNVPNLMSSDCMAHLEAVYACKAEELEAKPGVVRGVSVEGDSRSATLKWENTERAMVYHVYSQRSVDDEWKVQIVETAEAKIRNADIVVIVAANNRGLSPGNARLEYVSGVWKTIDM